MNRLPIACFSSQQEVISALAFAPKVKAITPLQKLEWPRSFKFGSIIIPTQHIANKGRSELRSLTTLSFLGAKSPTIDLFPVASVTNKLSSFRALPTASRAPTIELYPAIPIEFPTSSPPPPAQNNGSSSSSSSSGKRPAIDRPIVGHWMLFCASMVFGIIVWGGLTRLTESGLSIVEWAPVSGAKLPTSEKEWIEEFEKYKQFPEYKRIHISLTLDDFKRIYFMEWFHRNIGRLIGVVFCLPAIYFIKKGYIARGNIGKVGGLGVLLLGQGAMGWYMVSSGLRKELGEIPHAVPRVSHYRLAAHLALAYAFFAGFVSSRLVYIASQPTCQGKDQERRTN